ncbi:MAG: Ni-sirohydrochlorin a,c-diamide synthase [Methanothrix sp.]|nr:Ni-sirohydrochlorin a,c-diamide synthase [Methanothrix sp.]MCX8207704.1 Ni-sirohydrochlorin a,c-diamide synthase [Methanothrix sp.]
MRIPRIVIAGDRSSSGKTTIVAGLLSALVRMGLKVQAFKVAMDYIDPSYHTWITGRFCRNLDGYLMSERRVMEIFAHAAGDADIAVIEGVRGLYEGYEGDAGSTAQIAKMLRAPVILVVDARSITRSAAALVKGYMDYDRDVRIRGVILNKLGGERHADKATREIERYAGVPVVGAIQRNDEMHLAMRHLGLVPVMEGRLRHHGFDDRVSRIREIVEMSLDIKRLIEIAGGAEDLEDVKPDLYLKNERGLGLKVGVAQDEAFNFYYRDNLELIELAGAEVVPFSPIHDSRIPEVDGLYIGGGYPELYAEDLSRNSSMMSSISNAEADGMPVYAECGGLMYMCRELEWPDDGEGSAHKKSSYQMVGLVPALARRGRRRIVSYVNGSFVTDTCIGRKGDGFMGHEFHHSELVVDGDVRYGIRLSRGTGISDGLDGIVDGRMIASYSHLHSASYRGFPDIFLDACREYRYKA